MDHYFRPHASRNILRPFPEKHPRKDSTSRSFPFVGTFEHPWAPTIDVESAHFLWKPTLMVEHQKKKNTHQKEKTDTAYIAKPTQRMLRKPA